MSELKLELVTRPLTKKIHRDGKRPLRLRGYILVDGEDVGLSAVYGASEADCRRQLLGKLQQRRDGAKLDYDLAVDILAAWESRKEVSR